MVINIKKDPQNSGGLVATTIFFKIFSKILMAAK